MRYDSPTAKNPGAKVSQDTGYRIQDTASR